MSNTSSHPAVLAASHWGAALASAKGVTQEATAASRALAEGWTSAKLRAACDFGAACGQDASALSLAGDVAAAFTLASTNKELAGDSRESQGRKFAVFGRLGAEAEILVNRVGALAGNLVQTAAKEGSEAEDKARAKAATTRAFEKGRSLASLALKSGGVAKLTDGDILAVLCDGDAPSPAKALQAAVAALTKAAKLGAEGDWTAYIDDIQAAASVLKAREDAAKAIAKAEAAKLDADERAAEVVAKRKSADPMAGLLTA